MKLKINLTLTHNSILWVNVKLIFNFIHDMYTVYIIMASWHWRSLDSPHKGSVVWSFDVYLMEAWVTRCTNSRVLGDVIVMYIP